MKTSVIEKFLKYIVIDTQSDEATGTVPSTAKQLDLARLLVQELEEMGASDVSLDENGYVFATIPATTQNETKVVGFIAHMDTAPSFSGTNVTPQIIKGYDGSDIALKGVEGLYLSPNDFPNLLHYVGQDLITTDGTTLLGADDKAGIAEIMAMAEYLLAHLEIPHGVIKIGFTPDEEIGCGADHFDVARFGADIAYTVDGAELGELEYENFNAAGAKITIRGASIHPGTSKGKMINSMLIGMELQNMLPVFDNPMYTEGYEGFFHLDQMEGDVECTNMVYIIRDHDMDKFKHKKAVLEQAVAFLNAKYGENTVKMYMKDSYFNMKEQLSDHMYMIDYAQDVMIEMGITPIVSPIRGGTDGARLSFMGLPCPNLCAGGENFHGKYEFTCIQSMEKITELLIRIASKYAE
ncbi:MAG: peptidase T [Lachnospiraceae bacterium]